MNWTKSASKSRWITADSEDMEAARIPKKLLVPHGTVALAQVQLSDCGVTAVDAVHHKPECLHRIGLKSEAG